MSSNNDNFNEEAFESARQKKADEFAKNYDNMSSDSKRNYDQNFDRPTSDNSRRRKRMKEINSFSDDNTKAMIEKESMKALQRQKKEDKRIERSKAQHNKRMFKWIWLIMILFIAVILSQVLLVGINDMLAISRQNNPTKISVSIPEKPEKLRQYESSIKEDESLAKKAPSAEISELKDQYLKDIADVLYKAGVINKPNYFYQYEKMTTDASLFRKGDFLIDSNKDYEAIINFLQSDANREVISLQITEGMNVLEIANLLYDSNIIADKEAFINATNSDKFDEDYTFLKDIENKDERFSKLEGYLFPDTYEFYAGEENENVIRKLLNNFENKVISASVNDEIKDSSYSLDEILTIASIIQAEAADVDDMYNISSVIHNRLNYGYEVGVQFLGLDSTAYYPYRSKDDVPDDDKILGTINYDTTKKEGLPAGPICNPSLDAIKAAVDPNDTDYLYFCHSSIEDGSKPYYASNLADHNYNLSLAGVQ